VLDFAAKACAIAAGVLLTLITAMTCVSVFSRHFFQASLVGDFELTGVATGIAIALSLPLCQLRRGNIIVDFFTSRAPMSQKQFLDRLGNLALALVMMLLAWRTALGGINAWGNHSGSMLLGFPDWVVYWSMVPAFVLTAWIALWQCSQRQP
jgi:TRAP-type C4-dicarboxylate transport system permease small subunit